jgi:voltage-gated potassium channel Kch
MPAAESEAVLILGEPGGLSAALALYFSTRSVATVAGTPGASSGSAWYKAISALDTIAALLLVAVFTAALVRRLSRPRLTTLFGARAAPAHGHVLLVGFGQVGFRLALELRRRGVAVLGVERDAEAPYVRLARRAGIPVAIGRGDDRATLERLGIGRCAAVAAVTSLDLVNVEVGLTASDLTPGIPLVLRLGDGEVAAETDSLLHLGRIVDARKIAAQTLIQGIRGRAYAYIRPLSLDKIGHILPFRFRFRPARLGPARRARRLDDHLLQPPGGVEMIARPDDAHGRRRRVAVLCAQIVA